MIFKIIKNKRKNNINNLKSNSEFKDKINTQDNEKDFILDTTDYSTLNKVLPATGIKKINFLLFNSTIKDYLKIIKSNR